MITLIATMWGSKLGKWFIEIALVLVLIFGIRAYLLHEGSSGELDKLKVSSAALIIKAEQNIQTETAAHAADVKANQEKTNAALAANATLQSQLTQRVRDFDAYRAGHPDVPRAGGGPVATSTGECGAQSCGDLASRLATVGNELAATQGALVATLQSCQRDRDSLTGLPKDLSK